MLRVHLMQNWVALSDPAMEEALYEIASLRSSAGLALSDAIPDETTILNFRHMLEESDLAEDIFKQVNAHLARKGLLLKRGSIVDATIIAAPAQARDPSSCEWMLTQPIGGGKHPRLEAMFGLAGVPSRVVLCEAFSAMALIRSTDVVGIVPEPLLGHIELSGIVPIREGIFSPCDFELLMLTRPDVLLTPAAEYFAHCLVQVSHEALRSKPAASSDAKACKKN